MSDRQPAPELGGADVPVLLAPGNIWLEGISGGGQAWPLPDP